MSVYLHLPRIYIKMEKNKRFKIKDLEKYNLLDNTEIILLFTIKNNEKN